MFYGIIFSTDSKTEQKVNFNNQKSIEKVLADWQKPPKEQKDYWKLTEYGESDFENWVHCKWCACLSQQQFEIFVNHTNLVYSSVETLGSLGAPTPDGNINIGWSPAICFDLCEDNFILMAYITPYLEETDSFTPDDNGWKEIRRYLKNHYG
jgi:hypothetical protein